MDDPIYSTLGRHPPSLEKQFPRYAADSAVSFEQTDARDRFRVDYDLLA